jgi:hypothetical protein
MFVCPAAFDPIISQKFVFRVLRSIRTEAYRILHPQMYSSIHYSSRIRLSRPVMQ